jgi:O-antigen ligase
MAGLATAEAAAAAGALLLLIVLAGRFALREAEAFWWLTVALAPLAVPFRTGVSGVEVTVPFEPMLVLSGASLLLAQAKPARGWPALLRHPVVLAAAASVAWMAVASAAAPFPLAGVKATAVRALYAAVLLGGGLAYLRTEGDVRRLVLTAAIPLVVPTLCAFAVHAAAGFARKAAFESAQPFFSNRLDLVAVLTAWGVVGSVLLAGPGRGGLSRRQALALETTLALFLVVLVALFARSAVAGAGAALLALPLLAGRSTPRSAVAALLTGLGALAIAVTLAASSRAVRAVPEPPRGPLSPVADALFELDTLRDVSVLERLNRWNAAARMAAERPVTGFGPNGFERSYGPYQNVFETTTHSSFTGARGDAHSELLSALAEQGVPGLALLLALLVAPVAAAVRGARSRGTPGSRVLAIAYGAGLVAFAAMNVSNSFLDLDKVAPAFWLLAAGSVALDPEGLSVPPAPTSPAGC